MYKKTLIAPNETSKKCKRSDYIFIFTCARQAFTRSIMVFMPLIFCPRRRFSMSFT